MPGAGYNIPVSFSLASTTSLPISFNTPYVVNFNSPNASGGTSGSQADPYQPATAVSSASNGGPASSGLGAGAIPSVSTGSTINLPLILALAGGGLVLWLMMRHGKAA